MQTNSAHAIETARESVLSAERQLNQLRSEHDQHLRLVGDKILTVDISRQEGIAELSRLFVLERIYPARINAAEKSLSQARSALVGVTNEIISSIIGPVVSNLKNAAIDAAHKRLETNFPDRHFREEHVRNDTIVHWLHILNLPVVSESPNNPLAFSQHALDTLNRISEIEKLLS